MEECGERLRAAPQGLRYGRAAALRSLDRRHNLALEWFCQSARLGEQVLHVGRSGQKDPCDLVAGKERVRNLGHLSDERGLDLVADPVESKGTLAAATAPTAIMCGDGLEHLDGLTFRASRGRKHSTLTVDHHNSESGLLVVEHSQERLELEALAAMVHRPLKRLRWEHQLGHAPTDEHSHAIRKTLRTSFEQLLDRPQAVEHRQPVKHAT
mmetsp:Transcript_15868/g.28703  ORF Transcript_15868/g.28703 Transcript_15868/m.28703 type:complete len:211 (+) Transcript_15868:1072-1704(+)